MELDFDTDQEDLRDSIRAFLTAECPIALVRGIVEARIAGGTADAGALQAHMTELGWPALAIPAAAGGLDLGPIELGLLAEELGRALAPGPLFATVTQYVPLVRALASPDQAVAKASSTPSCSISTGPVIQMRSSARHSISSGPPGSVTVTRRSVNPLRTAHTVEAQAALPQALVRPAPRSQVRSVIACRETT